MDFRFLPFRCPGCGYSLKAHVEKGHWVKDSNGRNDYLFLNDTDSPVHLIE